MKKVLVAMFVFFVLTITQAFAYNVKDFSSDSKILSALTLLEQNGEYDVFANLKKIRRTQRVRARGIMPRHSQGSVI